MKKLLCAAFAVLVLAGCSGGAKTETKTCSMEQSGMKMEKTRMISHDKEKSNQKAIFICLRIRVIKFQALWRRI